MQFAKDDLKEFIEAWEETFHETITGKDAEQAASSLMDLYALLAIQEAE